MPSRSRSCSHSRHSSCSRCGDEAEGLLVNDDNVVAKYMMAADITNRVLSEILDRCVLGASIRDTCVFGDRRIEEECSKVFKKNKSMPKGIACPTCVSPNNYLAFYSPMICDNDAFLSNGDVVKIELGCHIDGFPALVAHTLIVGADKEPVSGRKADVVRAAYTGMQAMLRLVKPGECNRAIAKDLSTVVSSFKCELVNDWASFQIVRNNIEAAKSICNINSTTKYDKQEKFEIEPFEVYGIDVVVSTGEGKTRQTELRTTVHRKLENVYKLRMKASKAFLNEVEKRFGKMPFSLRSISNETNARLGVSECVNHGIMDAYPVLAEKEGEYIARFKTTLLLLGGGPRAITLREPTQYENYISEYMVTDERLKPMLDKPLSVSTATKRKRRKRTDKMAVDGDTP